MKITTHDKKTIEVKEPTEREQIEYLSMLDDYDKRVKEKGTLTAQKEAIEFQNRLLSKLSGMSMEEVKNLALIDKNKAIEAIKGRMMVLGKADYKMDF